jgi:excisionase family DNA binding protein
VASKLVHRPSEEPRAEASRTHRGSQRLLPVDTAAAYLGVSRATVERLVQRGKLPIVKIGRSTRYDMDDLDEFIDSNRAGVANGRPRGGATGSPVPLARRTPAESENVTLSDLIEKPGEGRRGTLRGSQALHQGKAS